jgi:hypothetical protein
MSRGAEAACPARNDRRWRGEVRGVAMEAGEVERRQGGARGGGQAHAPHMRMHVFTTLQGPNPAGACGRGRDTRVETGCWRL